MSIKSFKDLRVYQNVYEAAITVMTKIVSELPKNERYGLADQLGRSAKAIAPLIAEGFAKRHLPRSFQKYLDDAMGECNEVVVHLSYCIDLYGSNVDKQICTSLVDKYDLIGKQLNKLNQAWRSFTRKN